MAAAATAEQIYGISQREQQRPEETYGSLWDAEFTHRDVERKSFDPLASVRMLSYDLQRFGYVLSETREQVLNEEMSLMTEGMNRAARPTFLLKRKGNDLVYFKHGDWQSYTGMLITGDQVAGDEAVQDPRRQFLADAATDDLRHGYQMRNLKPGQQYVWYSSYRHDIEARYGKDFMRECGRFPDRQMGFLNRAYCNADGDIILESQTVDRSDKAAFEAAMSKGYAGATMDDMLRAYDTVLKQRYGRDFYAGRLDAERNEDAWQMIKLHQDLMNFFMNKLEAIAAQSLNMDERAVEKEVKRHMYGVWAAFKRRLDGEAGASVYTVSGAALPAAHYAMLQQEVQHAFDDFVSQGKTLLGCGGSIEMLQGEEKIFSASTEDVYKAIFGDTITGPTDQYGPLEFKCTKGHANKRERGKLVTKCRVSGCHDSVGCGPVKPEPKSSDSKLRRSEPSKQWRKLPIKKAPFVLAA